MAETRPHSLLHVAAIASVLGGVFCFLVLGNGRRTVRITSSQFNSSMHQLELEEYELRFGGEDQEQPIIHHAVDSAELYGWNEAKNKTDASRGDGPEQPYRTPMFSQHEPVELHGPESMVSLPVIVEDSNCEQGGIVLYRVFNAKTGHELPPIEEKYLHRYELYEYGTKATCSRPVKMRGGKTDTDTFLCLVKSSSTRKSHGFDYPKYHVVHLGGDKGRVTFEEIPFSHVWRHHDQALLEGTQALKFLEEAMTF